MGFNNFVKEVVFAIQNQVESNKKLVSFLFPLKNNLSPNKVESIIVPVFKTPLSFFVAGVDSGFVSKKISFTDLVLIKTVGVIFNYEESKLVSTNYFPAPVSLPTPILLKSGLEFEEELKSVSLIRLEKELESAIKIINEFSPKYFFVDGSLVPQNQDKPNKESILNNNYLKVIKLFQSLYLTAQKNSTTLIGCIEDSKGSRFKQILKEEIIPQNKTQVPLTQFDSVFDVSLLDNYLVEGERTFSFPYSSNSSTHNILKDYAKEWGEKIFVFYLKCSNLDNPLRVEFLLNKENELKKVGDEVGGIVYSLSSIHKEYSFPSVLIEADLRAGLSEQEINLVYERLIDKLGAKFRLRRNNRPFG